MECVRQTHASPTRSLPAITSVHGAASGSFKDAFRTFRTLLRALPHEPEPGKRCLRLAVLTGGPPAPGMNTAVRAAVRLAVISGHRMMGVRNGFDGLVRGQLDEVGWMSVSGWGPQGGSKLGTSRKCAGRRRLYAIARTLETHDIEGLLVIGGWAAYESAYKLFSERTNFPAFNIPIICLPASIDNNLPGSELSIELTLHSTTSWTSVDKIKQSAEASSRCFIVEVMGRYCGYLALMSGLQLEPSRSI